MARRRVTATVRCAKAGCREFAYFEYESQRERAEADKWRAERPWRCVRHTREDEVLTPDNAERVGVLTASHVYYRGDSLGLFWLPEGSTTGSGLSTGPGFKAFAKDFPEGARLVVTARIELPAPTEES